jgi:flagellar assembly factor FliW
MTETFTSTRFGTLEVPDDAVVEFPHGLIGLGGRRWTLVPHGDGGSFMWLHSLEDPALALPVTSPWRFFDGYEVELSDDEADRIGVGDPREAQVYVTVRPEGDDGSFVANLRAPIIVAGGRGHQVINGAADAPVRAPLFGGASAC